MEEKINLNITSYTVEELFNPDVEEDNRRVVLLEDVGSIVDQLKSKLVQKTGDNKYRLISHENNNNIKFFVTHRSDNAFKLNNQKILMHSDDKEQLDIFCHYFTIMNLAMGIDVQYKNKLMSSEEGLKELLKTIIVN